MNIQTLIGFIFGIDAGLAVFAVYLLYHQKRQMTKLNEQGEKLVEKLIARKEFDFWYNETVRLFIAAQDAARFPTSGNLALVEKLADQHRLAVRRYEDARMHLLELEQQ